MSTSLFNEFNTTSAAAWKQKIQVDLKGADYNETLLWKTDEGITVKPFYTKEDRTNNTVQVSEKGFNICQSIFIDDEKIANFLAVDALKRGANAIQFSAQKAFDYRTVLQNIDIQNTLLYFKLQFLSDDFVLELSKFSNSKNLYFQIDTIGNLATSGNWFSTLQKDHLALENIVKNIPNSVSVDVSLYENAGATIVQQLAYALAHANEYLHRFGKEIADKIHFIFSVRGNYFFEIAKLRAFRTLWKTLLDDYDVKNKSVHLFTQPSLRNKTLYDYNVNMLRTTSESMSAILGGSNTICNVSYDAIYHKSNEFGERISRNQLLILQQESGLKNAQHIANGTYYIEQISKQLAEKSLSIFKQIENGGGFLKQLKEGVIQRKINESATKEQYSLDNNETLLVGTNFLPNKENVMNGELEIYPFIKRQNHKTLISPILKRRLSESLEKKQLELEKLPQDE